MNLNVCSSRYWVRCVFAFRLMIAIVLMVGFSFGSSAVAAESTSVESAKAFYDKGDFQMAADSFLAVAQADGTSAPLLYNLANCYAELGDLGRAMLYYSRAARLDPSDKDIKNNLEYFASKVEDANRAELRGKKISVAPDSDTFFSSAHRLIAVDVTSNFWAVASVVCFIAFLSCVATYLFCSNILLRKSGFFGGIVLFIMSIALLVFSFMSADAYESHDRAVLMAYKTPLLLEPSSDSKPASNQLCQGTSFDIIAEESDVNGNASWYKVRLNADIEGWINADAVEII